MTLVGSLPLCLVAIAVLAGCASTRVSERDILVTEKIPRPDHILIHDFAATPADVPSYSSLAAADTARIPQTPEQIETGRRVGADIATRLVDEVRRMGLPAERAASQSTPQINDIVIHGYLLSVSEGSTAKRVAIGFGSGASELRVAVEGYQVTGQGLRKLGSGSTASGGNKAPGMAAPVGVALATGNPIGVVVVTGMKAHGEVTGRSRIEGRVDNTVKEIAKQLEPRFRAQGWIK
jgi:hypothetical protein